MNFLGKPYASKHRQPGAAPLVTRVTFSICILTAGFLLGGTPSLAQAPSGRPTRDLVVVVTAAGRPVPNAVVDYRGRQQRTDETGTTRFSFPGGGPDMTSGAFVVSAPGFATEASSGGIGDGTTVRAIELAPETRLVGRVLDTQGRPVTDARVLAHPVEPWRIAWVTRPTANCFEAETLASARTDENGGYSLPALGLTRRYRIVAATPNDPMLASVETFIAGSSARLDITLPAAGRLEAELEPPADTPLSTLQTGSLSSTLRRLECSEQTPLTLEWQDAASGDWQIVRGLRQATFDAETARIRIRFDQVPPGRVRLRSTLGRGAADDLSEPIDVVAGATSQFTMHLVAVRELRVRVVDERGAPVARARVEVERRPDFGRAYWNTDAEGAVTFQVHPGYEVPVRVELEDELALNTVLPAGREPPPPIVVPVR